MDERTKDQGADKVEELQADAVQVARPRKPFYQKVDGFVIGGRHSPQAFRSALAYKPRPDDLFIAAYPKCGSTWLQNIVAGILAEGAPPFQSGLDFCSRAPILHIAGAEAAETMRRPGAIKLHLPFQLSPWSSEAKYIFITRNPKDACVSFYHHTEAMPGYKFGGGSFDDFFELWLSGEVECGCYFDSLVSWHEQRRRDNVLFLVYEDVKRDTAAHVLAIAQFMGPRYKEALEKNGGKMLEDVIRHSSFSFMKEHFNKKLAELAQIPKEDILKNPDIPQGLKTVFSNDVKSFTTDTSKINFIRKGIVGDWKNYFSPSQVARLEEKFEQKTRGTNIRDLWADLE